MTEYLMADVRDPATILDAAGKILDLDRSVALSLVALLHFISDADGAHELKAAGVTPALRSHNEFARFFDGLELVEPGVEIVHTWHPELGEPVPGQDDGVIPGYGAVARKP